MFNAVPTRKLVPTLTEGQRIEYCLVYDSMASVEKILEVSQFDFRPSILLDVATQPFGEAGTAGFD
jgi:hypothetical protein